MERFTTTLAGAKYRQTEILQAIDWMIEGPVTIYLEAEPDNPHDPNAVRVDAGKEGKPRTRTKLGYLPAHIAVDAKDMVDDLQVTNLAICNPGEDFDFWNLRFTFETKKGPRQRKVIAAKVPDFDDEPDDKPVAAPVVAPVAAPTKIFTPNPKPNLFVRGFWAVAALIGFLAVVSWLAESEQKEPPRQGLTPAEVRERANNAGDGRVWVTLLKTSNIRRGPGTQYPVVRVINEGDRYRCFPDAPYGEWVKCYEGQYIHRSLIEFDANE